MPPSLTPCSACRRHVRADESVCPFCGGDVPVLGPRAVVDRRGLSRAAVLSLVATVGLLACAEDEPDPSPVYGAPAPDYRGGAGGAGGSANTGGAAGQGGEASAAGQGGEAGAGGK